MKFAIDDIKVRPGLCSHTYEYVYDFEDGYEDLEDGTIQPLQNYATRIFQPSFWIAKNLPSFDHSTCTNKGNYFLFQPQSYLKRFTYYENSISILDLKFSQKQKCIRFAYQISPNVVFKIFSLSEYEYNYDYAHNDNSLVWQSQ